MADIGHEENDDDRDLREGGRAVNADFTQGFTTFPRLKEHLVPDKDVKVYEAVHG